MFVATLDFKIEIVTQMHRVSSLDISVFNVSLRCERKCKCKRGSGSFIEHLGERRRLVR